MTYTPVELRHVRVPRALLGFKREAVQAVLTEVADSFEIVWRERHELSDRVEGLQEELDDLRAREHALSHALVSAQQAAELVREQAKREADVILVEARAQARVVTRNAESERQRLLVEAKRVEALLRAALGAMEEAAPDHAMDWPDRDDVRDADEPTDGERSAPEPAPAQVQLRKVSGGAGWGEDG